MLTIIVPEQELFDNDRQEFLKIEGATLQLEHSLVSLSKWEAEYEKPFLGNEERTQEEIIGYFRAMNTTPNVAPELFEYLSDENLADIQAYIEAKQTATWFAPEPPGPKSSEVITAELIYYWIVSYGMPVELYEHWHLNRLFTQLRVFNVKNSKPKKSNQREMARSRSELNAQRIAAAKAANQQRGAH